MPNGKILPVISNQKLNAYLKEIADICGIKKNLTFHLARHTFATTTTLAKGVPIETVSKMLGHTNIETTQIYARITNSKIGNDMQGLDKKFVGIEKIYKEIALYTRKSLYNQLGVSQNVMPPTDIILFFVTYDKPETDR